MIRNTLLGGRCWLACAQRLSKLEGPQSPRKQPFAYN